MVMLKRTRDSRHVTLSFETTEWLRREATIREYQGLGRVIDELVAAERERRSKPDAAR